MGKPIILQPSRRPECHHQHGGGRVIIPRVFVTGTIRFSQATLDLEPGVSRAARKTRLSLSKDFGSPDWCRR
jgi:hypothetical protein